MSLRRSVLRPLLRLALALLGLGVTLTVAATTPAPNPVTLALVSLADDARYQARTIELNYPGHPGGRLNAAAQLAIDNSRRALALQGWSLQLIDAQVANTAALLPVLAQLRQRGVRYWLLDLPADVLPQVVQAAGDQALLFNLSAQEDRLRGAECAVTLFHTIPSHAMIADALAQHLAARNWRLALVLQGPTRADADWSAAWTRAAKRYGVRNSPIQPFKLSSNPSERALANPRLLTSQRDHDVVVVWDSVGEFARALPYATQWPRPVLGSSGLLGLAWHPQWPRNGGPQLNRRFVQAAQRGMVSQDWAAWVAVKAIAELLIANGKAPLAAQAQALRSEAIQIDGYKGPPLSFRAWDGQLRQPVILAHADGVVAAAPLEGVLHPSETMDTLGFDATQTPCRLNPR